MIVPRYIDQFTWYNQKAVRYMTVRSNCKVGESNNMTTNTDSLLKIFNDNLTHPEQNSCVDLCDEFLLKDAGQCVNYDGLFETIQTTLFKSDEKSNNESDCGEIIEKTLVLGGY